MFASLKRYELLIHLMKDVILWHISVHYACTHANLCAAKVLFSWTMYSAGLWLACSAFQSLSCV